jgi:hypothetical protein
MGRISVHRFPGGDKGTVNGGGFVDEYLIAVMYLHLATPGIHRLLLQQKIEDAFFVDVERMGDLLP